MNSPLGVGIGSPSSRSPAICIRIEAARSLHADDVRHRSGIDRCRRAQSTAQRPTDVGDVRIVAAGRAAAAADRCIAERRAAVVRVRDGCAQSGTAQRLARRSDLEPGVGWNGTSKPGRIDVAIAASTSRATHSSIASPASRRSTKIAYAARSTASTGGGATGVPIGSFGCSKIAEL